jgi:hypothetical protein
MLKYLITTAVIATGLLSASAISAASDNVQVFRAGLASGIVDSVEADVRVFRGAGDVQAASDFTTPVRDNETPQVVAAGSKVWFVDRATDRLTTCRLRKTSYVSKYVIACQSRTLPY